MLKDETGCGNKLLEIKWFSSCSNMLQSEVETFLDDANLELSEEKTSCYRDIMFANNNEML